MKAVATLLLALVIAAPVAARAANSDARGTPASVDARFRGLDTNGEGMLDATEAGTQGDGVVRDVRTFLDRTMPATPAEEHR